MKPKKIFHLATEACSEEAEHSRWNGSGTCHHHTHRSPKRFLGPETHTSIQDQDQWLVSLPFQYFVQCSISAVKETQRNTVARCILCLIGIPALCERWTCPICCCFWWCPASPLHVSFQWQSSGAISWMETGPHFEPERMTGSSA